MDPDPFRCFGCDAVLAERTRFCPHCGVRLDSGVGEPVWPGAAETQVLYVRQRPRLIGVAPQDSTLLLGSAGIVLGAVLVGAGVLAVGWLLLVAGALLLVCFVALFRRRPASTIVRHVESAYGLARAQLGFTAAAASAWARGRADALRLRRRVRSLTKERRAHLFSLGESTYAGDTAGAEATRDGLRDLDERVAATTAEIARLERWTTVRIRAARFSRSRRAEAARARREPGRPLHVS